MAKKKLFGNVKEPCCETCAHGKLSANGETVLCVQGGAVPLTHSCRRYQYDPLRRVPKRRPQLGDFSAADFALDDIRPSVEQTTPAKETVESPEHSTFQNLFAYLDEHETPDADTIRAILNKTYDPNKPADEPLIEEDVEEETASFETDTENDTQTVGEDEAEADTPTASEEAEDDATPKAEAETIPEAEADAKTDAQEKDTPAESEEDLLEQILKEAAQINTKSTPDNTPDIEDDLSRLDMSAVPAFARAPITEASDVVEPLILTETHEEEVGMITDLSDKASAPLSVNDLLFLPRGTPSDNDDVDDFDGGFTPLTGN